MKRTMILCALAPAIARADVAKPIAVDSSAVLDPDHTLDAVALQQPLFAAPEVAKAIAACTPAGETHVFVWVVLDRGKIASVDAAGSGDRKVDSCVAKAVARAKVAAPQARAAAAFEIVVGREEALAISDVREGGSRGAGRGGGGTGPGKPFGVGPGRATSSGPIVDGDLSAEAVQRVMRAHLAALRRCYSHALKADPSLRGALSLRFEIDKTGAVTSASVDDRGANRDLDGCIVAVLKAMKFPAGFSAIVSYPLTLEP
jgi:hypothetical protein